MKKYSQEVHDFIRDNVVGRRVKELAEMTNSAFGTEFTVNKMRAYMQNHNLRNGMPTHRLSCEPSKKYPAEIIAYIMVNYKGCGPTEMAERLNTEFGTHYTVQQLNSYYCNHHLLSGLTGRFEKGHVPINKGKKGCYAPGCEKSWFSNGHIPATTQPLGTVTLREDGYLWKKIAEPKEWKPMHIVVWEDANGPVPDGYIVTFLDGDKTNTAIDNLTLITRAESLELTRKKLRTSDAELTKTGILTAKLNIAASKAKKKGAEP